MSGRGPRRSPIERLAAALVGVAGVLVPREQREAWREEWNAEIWHHVHDREEGGRAARPRLGLVALCAGAIPHAISIRAEGWSVDSLSQDVRFAVRTLLRRPGFTAVAVAALALGIGANTAVFTVLDAVVLRPLPMPNADRLLYVYGRMWEGEPVASVSPPDFLDYRRETGQVVQELAAYSTSVERVVSTDGPQPEELVARRATGNFLAALGLEPALGRSFTPEEIAGGPSDVVMISYGLWERLFGSDRDVIGRTVSLDGESHTVVGVMPPHMGFQDEIDVWGPLTFGAPGYQSRAAHFIRPLALLRPGATREQAQRVFDAIAARLAEAYPETNDGWVPPLRPLQAELLGPTRPALLVMMGAVGLVLLIACLNVGSLLVARSSERQGEIAVRAALGASRRRVTRQLFVESTILSTVSAAVGLILATAGVALVQRFAPPRVPQLDGVTLDGRVLLVTLAVTLGVSLAFGLVPAWALARGRLSEMVGSAGGARSPRRHKRLRSSLVVTEVALSFVLLTGALLLARSFMALSAVDPGFDARDVLTIPLSITQRDVPTAPDVAALEDRIGRRVQAVPGVQSVAYTDILPMTGSGRDTYVYAEGQPPAQLRNVENTAEYRVASEAYFDAMGIPVLSGRAFTAEDVPGSEPSVLVSQSLAGRLWPGEDAVGRGLVVLLDTLTTARVVGVVGDLRQYSLNRPPRDEFYLSTRQTGRRDVTLVVKGRDSAPPVAAIRAAVREVDPRQPLTRVATMEDYVGGSLASGRFQALLLGVFAGLAVLLAAVGLYGVLTRSVVERRREIGMRMAVGAERGSVVRMVVGQGLGLAGLGILAGGVGAVLGARVLEAFLFGVEPLDPLTFALTPMLLLSVVFVASWLPARRAARVDPIRALQSD